VNNASLSTRKTNLSGDVGDEIGGPADGNGQQHIGQRRQRRIAPRVLHLAARRRHKHLLHCFEFLAFFVSLDVLITMSLLLLLLPDRDPYDWCFCDACHAKCAMNGMAPETQKTNV
jgi:hypothetical protein